MAFFKINGLEFPILDGSASVDEEVIGSSTRAFNGHLIQTARKRARMISCTTPILSATEAKAFVGLIRGDGHYWDFEDTYGYSSRGLGISGGVYTISLGFLNVSSGSTVVYPVGYPASGPWTIGAYYDGEPIIVDSDGNEYRSGAPDPGMNNILDLTASGFLLWGRNEFGTPTVSTFGYAFAVPYLFTSEMLLAYSTSGFQSELPALTISGSIVDDENVTVKIEHGSISKEPIQFMSGGSITTGYQVSFKMREVL